MNQLEKYNSSLKKRLIAQQGTEEGPPPKPVFKVDHY